MPREKWHPESGVNPPFTKTRENPMTKGELREYHETFGHMGSFFDLYQYDRPHCSGGPGCPCPACCKMRGQLIERGRE